MSIVEALTADLLARVYRHLSCETDRKAWRLVCKEFHRVDSVSRPSIRVLRVEFLDSLLRKYTRIESLDLSVCPRIDDGTVSILLSGAADLFTPAVWRVIPPRFDSVKWTGRLRRLVLSHSTGLRHSGLEQLVRACPMLESIDVSYSQGFGDREAAAVSLAVGLRELKMDKCLGLTDVGLAKIAVGCPRLEKLSLKWCLEIGDLGVDLLCKKCFSLKFLDLSYLKVTNDSLRSIAPLISLEVLSILGCSLVDDVGLQFLGDGCPSLRVIDVSRCDAVSSSGIISIIRGHDCLEQLKASFSLVEVTPSLVDSLKDLKALTSFRIDGARASDCSLQSFSKNFKNLSEIGLSKCTGVTDIGIIQLVSGSSNLRLLDLTCCHSITDAAVFSVSNSCRNLTCLKLESCSIITEKGLYYLGSFCLLLEELDLTDCSCINNTGLKYLSRCSKLRSLKLGLCMCISDQGLCHIASNCKNIYELDLYKCCSIGDEGLEALSSSCKRLKILNISYCTRITDKGLEYISKLEELSNLDMRGLVQVTCLGITALAAGCKRLANLDMKHCQSVNDSGFWALAHHSQNLRQVNLSYSNISDLGLCMMMGNLTRLQDAKLLHLSNVTVQGFELALRACCMRIKKVKLVTSLRYRLSREIIETLHSRGCKIRWD
ncbi:hypothetical protein SAY86_016650 [Trapa natans]|uniref:F-box/LRR-repeat protein 15-like leucin rich repeat domain-containing protein n=1 Tax=Trapa natans TaxID=22666 RepID=A0AAN7L7A5_TRANT|nr:hypothetical protein SAY86_016650 [Trapa natans]